MLPRVEFIFVHIRMTLKLQFFILCEILFLEHFFKWIFYNILGILPNVISYFISIFSTCGYDVILFINMCNISSYVSKYTTFFFGVNFFTFKYFRFDFRENALKHGWSFLHLNLDIFLLFNWVVLLHYYFQNCLYF